MYDRQIKEINDKINKTGKAVIGIGCSFVQGQGAVDDSLYIEYEWKFSELGKPLSLDHLSKDEKDALIKKYPSVEYHHKFKDKLDFTFMEYDNSFVNVLATKYFCGDYASINLGRRGNGNRSSIKDLYFYPEINWDKLKEIIVIYCPSGPERFDFINDSGDDHHRWTCVWPNYQDKPDGPRKTLWKGYHDALYSSKFEILEQIAHVQELMSWCERFNARLIITPAFDRRYTKTNFYESLNANIGRNSESEIVAESKKLFFKKNTLKFIKLWPWDKMFKPDGQETFADMALFKEFPDEHEFHHYFEFIETGSPNNWITKCAHPSAKAHDYFAKLLYNHITKT